MKQCRGLSTKQMTHLISQLLDLLRIHSIDVDRFFLFFQSLRIGSRAGLNCCIDFDVIAAGFLVVSTDQKTCEVVKEKMMWSKCYQLIREKRENYAAQTCGDEQNDS